jgi:predicted transcriptional regulator
MKARSHPFSVRLSPDLDARITAMAKRTRRSKAAVLQSLADEGERMRRHPRIWFMGQEDRRRAAVAGTRWKLYLLIPTLEHFDNDYGRFAEEFGQLLTEADCRAALAYYGEFKGEIDAEIAWNNRPLEEVVRDFPGAQTFVIQD